MRVYYSPLLKAYIDLDSISLIADVKFLDHMGHGGYYVSFDISLKLHDDPLTYTRKVENRFIDGNPAIETFNGEWQRPEDCEENEIKAVADLQREVEVLVNKWIEDAEGVKFV